MRWNRAEASGALGDLGTFIPLLAAMVQQCGLQLGPSLLAAGVMNIVTGLAFGIPMPVQPMKAIATVAIAEGLTEAQILTAGITTGAVILLLGVMGLADRLSVLIPKSVVRGIQLALGLKLLSGGFSMIARCPQWLGWDSVALGVACAIAILALYFSTRVPGALLIFVVGLAALLASKPTLFSQTTLGMDWHLPDLSHPDDWWTGWLRGTVPQVPLTLLNSVIAVCALSADLFPDRSPSPRRVAVSVGLMNILACPLGAMPMCHGTGGLAGQYRFGARTGGSVVMLGVVKCFLAIVVGSSLLVWLQGYPQSVLGVLLLFSGLELSMVCRDQTQRASVFVMLLTTGACMAVNTAVGFVIGWLIAAALSWGVFRVEPPAGTEHS